MARILLVIMMICACFCVTGCKKKDSTGDAVEKKAAETKQKAHKATDEAEAATGLMEDMQ